MSTLADLLGGKEKKERREERREDRRDRREDSREARREDRRDRRDDAPKEPSRERDRTRTRRGFTDPSPPRVAAAEEPKPRRSRFSDDPPPGATSAFSTGGGAFTTGGSAFQTGGAGAFVPAFMRAGSGQFGSGHQFGAAAPSAGGKKKRKAGTGDMEVSTRRSILKGMLERRGSDMVHNAAARATALQVFAELVQMNDLEMLGDWIRCCANEDMYVYTYIYI